MACGAKGRVGDYLAWLRHTQGEAAVSAALQTGAWVGPQAPPPAPPLALADAIIYHLSLTPTALAYYHKRGLTDDTILRRRLGYGAPPGKSHQRFVLPILSRGQLVNLKFRRDDTCPTCGAIGQSEGEELICLQGHRYRPADPDEKYIGIQGHNRPFSGAPTKRPAPV